MATETGTKTIENFTGRPLILPLRHHKLAKTGRLFLNPGKNCNVPTEVWNSAFYELGPKGETQNSRPNSVVASYVAMGSNGGITVN